MIGLKWADHMLATVQVLLEWALKQNERLRRILLEADRYHQNAKE
jgi:hypothetical protein